MESESATMHRKKREAPYADLPIMDLPIRQLL